MGSLYIAPEKVRHMTRKCEELIQFYRIQIIKLKTKVSALPKHYEIVEVDGTVDLRDEEHAQVCQEQQEWQDILVMSPNETETEATEEKRGEEEADRKKDVYQAIQQVQRNSKGWKLK